jgi:hypothetical protein
MSTLPILPAVVVEAPACGLTLCTLIPMVMSPLLWAAAAKRVAVAANVMRSVTDLLLASSSLLYAAPRAHHLIWVMYLKLCVDSCYDLRAWLVLLPGDCGNQAVFWTKVHYVSI